LHVIPSIDRRSGGPPVALGGLAQAEAAAGLSVHVCSTYAADHNLDMVSELRRHNVQVTLIGPATGKLNRHPDLKRILEGAIRQADVVHIHTLWEEIQHQAARICRRMGVPYVVAPHGMLDPWSLRQRWLKKKLYMMLRLRRNLDGAALLHYCSETERDLVSQLDLASPAAVIANGLDLSEFQELPPPAQFRDSFPEIAGRDIVLFLSRLHPKKGLDLLIPAFAAAKLSNTVLVIAGPAAEGYLAEVKRMVRDQGIEGSVIFTGMLYGRDRIAALAAADLFVLPSYQENFGIAVIESLAAGTPVVISDQVNIHPEIAAAQVGAVVSTQVNAVTSAINKWMGDPALRQQTGERARQWATQQYDWRHIAALWRDQLMPLAREARPIAPQSQAARAVADNASAVPLPVRPSPATHPDPVSRAAAQQPADASNAAAPSTHVLHVISTLDLAGGGPPAALAGLTRAQVKAGLKVSVVSSWTGRTHPVLAEQLREAGIDVTLVGPTFGRLQQHPRMHATMDRLVAAADIVHIHALWEEVQHQAARAAQRHGKPYLIRPCGMLDPWSLRQSRLKKKIYMAWRLRQNLQRATAIHFTSQTEAELTAPLALGAPPIIEPNGVSLSEFEELPPPGAFRSRYPQLDGKRMVLFLSRIHHKKGLDLLIPAFAQANVKDAVLVLAGPDHDGYGLTLRSEIVRLGIEDRVIWTGMLYGRDRVAAFADADLFCLPSYQENFGIAVVEALAAGTPVVISDQVNIWQEIQSAAVGGVVPMQTDALAAELQRWLQDASLRNAAAAKAAGFVRDRFDWQEIANRWVGRYAELRRVTFNRSTG
jgi:glycosyltransferase involved in cell wall biosynthesis